MDSREEFVALLFRYLDPLLSHYSELGAWLNLAGGGATYEDEVIPFEAWARPLWGLAPFWAGGGRSEGHRFEQLYLRGLATGTDPDSPEYWGGFRDHDQRFVEMAAIAYGLLLAPDVLWAPLRGHDRVHVARWLAGVNDYELPHGNWLWFRVLVNLALFELGQTYSENLLAADLAELDGYYLGNGWYQDGPMGLPDYYNAMTFHFFSLLCVGLFGSGIGERRANRTPSAFSDARLEAYEEKARRFATDYVRLFSARGETVPYGRSLTYRFAHAGFWSMAAALRADLGSQFSPGVLKGLVKRNVEAWDPHRVCDNGGVMAIGYHYPNLHMAESYNAAGSPMWAFMAFACLALPERDAFWKVPSLPLPEQPVLCETGTGVVQRDSSGEVVLYPGGRVPGHPFAQSQNKYSKFAYSSRFGFSVSRSERTLEEAAPDSMLAFVVDGFVFVRDGVGECGGGSVGDYSMAAFLTSSPGTNSVGHCSIGATPGNRCKGAGTADSTELFDDELLDSVARSAGCAREEWDVSMATMSLWSPMPNITVRTVVVPSTSGEAHVRIHVITSSIDCEAYDCGFAVPGDYHRCSLDIAEKVCAVRGVSRIVGVDKVVLPGEPVLVKAEPNTNITCQKTVIPAVRYRLSAGETSVCTIVRW